MFLLDTKSQNIDRLGFYTTRWVQAGSMEEAGPAACRLVVQEFERTGTKNPPDEPIHVGVERLVEVSWFEAVRHGPGRGFTFYPDDAS